MGCSSSCQGKSRSHQPPGESGGAVSSTKSSKGEVQPQNAHILENNNTTPAHSDVEMLDGTAHYHLAASAAVQTDEGSVLQGEAQSGTSAKMPLVNGTSHKTSPSTRTTLSGNDAGLVNLGFQGSTVSLTQFKTAQELTFGGGSSGSAKRNVLDEKQRHLVQDSWKTLVPNLELYGSMMFAKLTIDYPVIGNLFPFGGKGLTYGQLVADPDLRAHGKRVLETIGSLVEDLEDMDLVIPLLEDLGDRHSRYGAKKSHLQALGMTLLHILQDGLGKGFTDEVRDAWINVYGIISDTMSTTMSDGPLTTRQRELVLRTWTVLSLYPEEHGATMFAKLVTDYPSVGMLFPFGDKKLSYDLLREDADVRAHGKRVMETVGQAVTNLDDLDTVVTVLRNLAQRHIGYRVTRQQFTPVGEALLHAIQEGLGRSFTTEVKESWTSVFRLVVDTMSSILPEGTKKGISPTHRRLVQTSWKNLARDPEKHGAVMFAKLASDHPEVGNLFPFGGKDFTYDELLLNTDVGSHGKRVMEAVGLAVNGLDDLDLLVTILQDMAKRHAGYNVMKRHFVPVVQALTHAVREGLGSSFTAEIHDAWEAVITVIVSTMSEFLPDGTVLTEAQKRLVQTSWKTLSWNPERHGAVMFARLVTDYPAVGRIFPFGQKNLTYEQLLRDRDVRSHGRRVMETVGHAVDGLNDLGNVVPILQDLAKRHVGYTVTKRQFDPVVHALTRAIAEGLGSSFTIEVRDAWAIVLKVVVDTMSEFLPDGQDNQVLTEAQKQLVQTTWKKLSQNPEEHGSVMFAKLVTDYPDVGKLFPFGEKNLSYDQLKANKDARSHGKRVMETVGVAVDGLDDLDLLVPILQDLAKRHVGYKVKKRLFTPVGNALIHAIGGGLGSSFNEDVKNAWAAVFKVIVDTMSEFLSDGEPVVTENHKRLVQTSWKTLSSDLEEHGATMFARLTLDHPDVGVLFPFGGKGLSYDQLKKDNDVRSHGKRVMETIGHAVNGLDDLDLLVPILEDLAKRHAGYNVQKSHFLPIFDALMHAVKDGLGSSLTDEVRDAWKSVFIVVIDTMSPFLLNGQTFSEAQKRVVQTTWKTLATDPEKHGAVMFARLATDHPQIGTLFPFGNKNLSYDQLKEDKDARSHGKRVMETVGVAVNGLEDLDLLVPILQDLAKRHAGYDVRKKYFAPVVDALLHAIENGLGSSFTSEVRQAWDAVLQLVVDTMSDFLLDDDSPITEAQKSLVQTSWKALAGDLDRHGAVMFATLVSKHPDVAALFPFGGKNLSYAQLLNDTDLRAHGRRIMETVGSAVEGLDDLDLLVPILEDLAKRHVGYGVTKTHFGPVGASLLHAVSEGLGDKFDSKMEAAWQTVFKLVVSVMSGHLPDQKQAEKQVEAPLSAAQKTIVQTSWNALSPDPIQHGSVMFAKLTTSYPSIGKLFPFGKKGLSYASLLRDPDVQGHGKRVMVTVGQAVAGLDALDILGPVLQDLARRHVSYGVYKHHIGPVGESLLYAIKKGLGDAFTRETELAWKAVFQIVSNIMTEVLPEGPISKEEKQLVQETWEILARDPTRHGAEMFAKLVTDYPDAGKLFPFGRTRKSYDQLVQDAQVRAHGTRVMQTIGKAVAGLDDPISLEPILRDLARRHRTYRTTRQHFVPVGTALTHAIKTGLASSYTDIVKQAWTSFFQFVVGVMSDELPDGSLTTRQKEVVQTTWKNLSTNPEKHGAVMFAKLSTEYPAVGALFSFGRKGLSYHQLLSDPEVKAHGKQVMQTIGHAVDGLEDMEILVPVLEDLAIKHRQYGVTKKHFAPVGASLVHALKEGLGEDFSEDVQGAWEAVFQIVATTMSEVLPENALTEDKKRLVRESWTTLSVEPTKHGVVMFTRLVTQNPNVGLLFPFGGKKLNPKQLMSNEQLRAHGTKVMETVGVAVESLDDLDALVGVVKDLATRHVAYNVTKQHLEPVGEALMYAVREGLGGSYSTNIEEAWTTVFQLISDTMSEVLPDGPISARHIDLVQSSWEAVAEDPERYGAIMFARLTTDYPLIGSLFAFGGKTLSYDQLLQDEDIKKHGTRFMNVVGNAVRKLDNLDALVPMLEDLAKRHAGYGVTTQHFPAAGEALMHAVSEAVDEGYTAEVRGAWKAVFQVVAEVMSKKLPEGLMSSTPHTTRPLSHRHRELVQQTWKLISAAPDKHGSVLFAKLVTDNPKIGKLFPFGKKKLTYKKLVKENALISHGERFMTTMGLIVDGLGDLPMLVPALQQLAIRHAGYGVTKDHLQPTRSALVFTLRQGLGKAVFSQDVQDAWINAFKLIEDIMSEKL